MLVHRAVQAIRHRISAPFRRASRKAARSPRLHPNPRPEFPRVNTVAGVEPLKPELSGLQLRPVKIPKRLTRLLIAIAYRWHPSREYRRRQDEMQMMNRDLKRLKGEGPPPPVLLYPEESDISPARIQPILDLDRHGPHPFHGNDPPRDLRDLEEAAQLRNTWMIQPLLRATDQDYFRLYRSILPRRYRHFLRHSPYPRIAAAVILGVTGFMGTMWVTQLQQAEALARGQFTVARQAYQTELDGALRYGVAPAALTSLQKRARSLDHEATPTGIVPSRARLRFYGAETRSYRSLRKAIRQLERQALHYWSRQASATYGRLLEAAYEARSEGLHVSLPAIPACSTARCFQGATTSQSTQTVRLRSSLATLHTYAASISASADPSVAAASNITAARNLQGIMPRAAVLAPIATLDQAYATAAGADDYARAGALARLDTDTLRAALIAALPARAIVVSMGDGTLSCFNHRRAVYGAPITAGSDTPVGVFHIQAKQSSIAATYWRRTARSYTYRYGSIPLWMPFSGNAALQGAPWRTAFGPGSGGTVSAYAPSTPASIDLPMSAATHLFHWTSTGTEVVVY